MELSENVIVVDSDVSKLKDYSVQADIIIMDPPWYLECYKLFMNIAYLISNPNAIVLSVMPPITTRPTVKDEYEKELCFKAQKIINDKLLAYSRVYYTTEETVLFKMLLFDSVLSDLKDEGYSEGYSILQRQGSGGG